MKEQKVSEQGYGERGISERITGTSLNNDGKVSGNK